MLFGFSEEVRWNAEVEAVEVRFSFGNQRAIMRVPLRTFEDLGKRKMSPTECVHAYHFRKVQFEQAAEMMCRFGRIEDGGVAVVEKLDFTIAWRGSRERD